MTLAPYLEMLELALLGAHHVALTQPAIQELNMWELAQLGERNAGSDEFGGSIPLCSTNN